VKDDSTAPRFTHPTTELLRPLSEDAGVVERVRAVLAREIDPRDASPACRRWVGHCHADPAWHEQALAACNDLLGGYGVESMNPGDAHYTDCGVGMCPAFSFGNTGDIYDIALYRDHERGAWVVDTGAALIEAYEREHKIGDFEEFASRPDECPACRADDGLVLEHFPKSSRGDTYSWVCRHCNHHAFAVVGFDPAAKADDSEIADD